MHWIAPSEKDEATPPVSWRGLRVNDLAAHHANGVLGLAPNPRCDELLALPEAADAGLRHGGQIRNCVAGPSKAIAPLDFVGNRTASGSLFR